MPRKKKKTDVTVHIKKKGDYAILEPFNVYNQKKTKVEKPNIKSDNKEKIERKKEIEMIAKQATSNIVSLLAPPKEVKPQFIVQETKPKEIKPEKPVQKLVSKPPEKTTKPVTVKEIPIDQIETDIDKLMRIIDEKDVVSIEYLSKELKIDVDRLEAWAKMLEDRGLIEIIYPVFGLPKLRKKKWKKES